MNLQNPYLNEHETTLLVELVRDAAPKTMIEFGCNLGRTSDVLLKNVPTLQHYVGIDVPSFHRPTLPCQNSEIPDCAGFFARGDPRFELIIRDSRELGPQDLPPCEAIFIDGDHSAAAVRHDSELARAIVQSPGIIIWHDYGNEAVEVTAVIDQLSQQWPIKSMTNSWLAYLRI